MSRKSALGASVSPLAQPDVGAAPLNVGQMGGAIGDAASAESLERLKQATQQIKNIENAKLLGRAIETYIEDVSKEAPADRDRLLSRRAPWHVRASHAFRFLMSVLRRPSNKDEGQAGYSLPCPA